MQMAAKNWNETRTEKEETKFKFKQERMKE